MKSIVRYDEKKNIRTSWWGQGVGGPESLFNSFDIFPVEMGKVVSSELLYILKWFRRTDTAVGID